MGDQRVKASMSKINADIAPYISKHLLGNATVDDKNVPVVISLLLHKYRNVDITEFYDSKIEKSCMRIVVKGLLGSEEKVLVITGMHTKKKLRTSSNWIDDIEEYLAATEN